MPLIHKSIGRFDEIYCEGKNILDIIGSSEPVVQDEGLEKKILGLEKKINDLQRVIDSISLDKAKDGNILMFDGKKKKWIPAVLE